MPILQNKLTERHSLQSYQNIGTVTQN